MTTMSILQTILTERERGRQTNGEKERDRQTDRQTDRDRQRTDGEKNRNKRTKRRTDRDRPRQTYKETDRPTGRLRISSKAHSVFARIPSRGQKRSSRSCPRWVKARHRSTPSM